MAGKKLDCLYEGQLFQALHVKWQRKLDAFKPGETFYALYDQALMLQSCERQYAADNQIERLRKPKILNKSVATDKSIKSAD